MSIVTIHATAKVEEVGRRTTAVGDKAKKSNAWFMFHPSSCEINDLFVRLGRDDIGIHVNTSHPHFVSS